MCVPDPRECTGYANRHRQIRNDSHDQNGVVVVLVVDEDECDSKNKPDESRRCAAGVYPAKVLQNGRTS